MSAARADVKTLNVFTINLPWFMICVDRELSVPRVMKVKCLVGG